MQLEGLVFAGRIGAALDPKLLHELDVTKARRVYTA